MLLAMLKTRLPMLGTILLIPKTAISQVITSDGFELSPEPQLLADIQPQEWGTNGSNEEDEWNDGHCHTSTHSVEPGREIPSIFQDSTPAQTLTTQASHKARVTWTAGHN
jgi:hypothetical protein